MNDVYEIEKKSISILTSERFRLDIEGKLFEILSKHYNKDLTSIEAILMLRIFKIGKNEIDKIDNK